MSEKEDRKFNIFGELETDDSKLEETRKPEELIQENQEDSSRLLDEFGRGNAGKYLEDMNKQLENVSPVEFDENGKIIESERKSKEER